jgi:hypothetical protein
MKTDLQIGEVGMTLDRDEGRYAGLGIRFAALVIDTLLFGAVFFPVTRLVKGVWLMSAGDHRWSVGLFITDPLCLAFLAVMVAYPVNPVNPVKSDPCHSCHSCYFSHS